MRPILFLKMYNILRPKSPVPEQEQLWTLRFVKFLKHVGRQRLCMCVFVFLVLDEFMEWDKFKVFLKVNFLWNYKHFIHTYVYFDFIIIIKWNNDNQFKLFCVKQVRYKTYNTGINIFGATWLYKLQTYFISSLEKCSNILCDTWQLTRWLWLIFSLLLLLHMHTKTIYWKQHSFCIAPWICTLFSWISYFLLYLLKASFFKVDHKYLLFIAYLGTTPVPILL